MDLDVRSPERQKSKDDGDAVLQKDKAGGGRKENEESNALLSPRRGGMAKRPKNAGQEVQWHDRNGNKLVEVLEFQPSDTSDSDEDDGVDSCICTIL